MAKPAIYTCRTTFGTFRFEADLTQAAAPIRSLPDHDDDDTDGFSTPFQTADARHDAREAAKLLIRYFGRDYWLDPTAEVEDGMINGMPEDDYIDSLIVSVE